MDSKQRHAEGGQEDPQPRGHAGSGRSVAATAAPRPATPAARANAHAYVDGPPSNLA